MTALPVTDLLERLELGLARGGRLLTSDERQVVDGIASLPDDAALLHARLCARRPVAFRLPDLEAAGVQDVPAAVDVLRAVGLVTHEVPWTVAATCATSHVLKAGCRRLGLAVSGRREELVARLLPHADWDDAAWLALPHARLVLRLERMATLELTPDPARPVLERMGRLRWWPYALSTGEALLPSREAWLAWEALAESMDTLDLAGLLAALDTPAWPPGQLDLRRELVRRVRELGLAAERAGALDEARAAWEGLLARGVTSATVVQRLVHTLEAAGDPGRAYEILREAHDGSAAPERVALTRTGRRLAGRVHRAWVPEPPLLPAAVHTLRLDRVEATAGPRPLYASTGADVRVEEAAAARLRAAGRTVLHAEGHLWRTILALLLADAMFLPVPGQLPVPRLSGPLDAFTPAFAARRPQVIQEVLDDVAAGLGPIRVAQAWERYEGHVVTGVDWAVAPVEQVVAATRDLGPSGLDALLRAVLVSGWRALRGLPDLVVLAGPACRVEGLHPASVPADLVLVEVKGERDTLRDAQLVWLDRLTRVGTSVAVWRVVPAPGVRLVGAGGAGRGPLGVS